MNEDAYLDSLYEDQFDLDFDDPIDSDYYDDEPDLDFMFEHDSAMESIGWGDDDAYGGGEDW